MNNLVPPRDPNNDEDEDEHEWQDEPAVIREPEFNPFIDLAGMAQV